MQTILSSHWFRNSVFLTLGATLLLFIPWSPIAVLGGLALITILPGAQLLRWLGLYPGRWNFEAVVISIALGMVTSPVLIYWGGLLFGLSRPMLLLLLPLYNISLAAGVEYRAAGRSSTIETGSESKASSGSWVLVGLLMGVSALGVALAYFELETGRGFYPVRMEDWQKHYGVAFALRYTGIPPTSMFFYGMFPDEQLVYYYFLHLNGAALDLLQNAGPFLHHSFVIIIVLASLTFSGVFLVLARTVFRRQSAAVWALAFATVIGGLDVIPMLQRTVQKYRGNFPDEPLPAGIFLPREHIDNWISALSLRLNTFFAHHIWVPQHLTALTILCLGFYLYLKVRARRKLLILFPILLFSLLGHSTWIAAIFSGCLLLFGLFQILSTARRQGAGAARRLFLGYAAVAIGFALIAAPFILSLIDPNAPKSGIAFEIPRLDSWLLLRPFQVAYDSAVWARLVDLPLHFSIEMGLLLIAGLTGLLLYWYDKSDPVVDQTTAIDPADAADQPPGPRSLLPLWVLLLIVGALVVTFFASGRGWADLGLVQNNDLGLRALMPGQLVLALFAGYFMVQLPAIFRIRWARVVMVAITAILIGLGLLSTAWEFTAMGLAKYWDKPLLLPEVYQTLQAMPEVTQPSDKQFPVVQHRLHRDASRFQLSLGGRPVGFSTGEAIVFHPDVQDLALALDLSQQAFDNSLPVWSYQMFQNLGANYVFVGPAEREAVRHPEKYGHGQYFQPVLQQGDFEIYRIQPPEYDPQRNQAQFDEGNIEFLGYFLDSRPRYPGKPPASTDGTPEKGLVTAWRLNSPAGKNYTAFIHFVDPKGNIIAQADHQLWAWDVKTEGPTTIWQPKLTYLDIVPLPEAVLTAETPLSVRIGLWLPESDQQFPPASEILNVDSGGRLIIGEIGTRP